MIYSILAGLGIGLLGSTHCVGMCGPIALSLPIPGDASRIEQLFRIVLYNIGRATTYTLLGALLGLFGNQFVLFGYQQVFSVVIGLMILVFLLAPFVFSRLRIPFFERLISSLKAPIARLISRSYKSHSFFLIGMANGLLPCGLIYLALGNALALADPYASGIFMLMFGMGTMPLMIFFMFMRNFISFSLRLRMQKIVPFFVAFTALLIILRGLDLDIPFISPHAENSTQVIRCHKL